MERKLPHLHPRALGRGHAFQAKGGGGVKKPSDVANRTAHAKAVLDAIDVLQNVLDADLTGFYLEVRSRSGDSLKRDSLDSSGLTLLPVKDVFDLDEDIARPMRSIPFQETMAATTRSGGV